MNFFETERRHISVVFPIFFSNVWYFGCGAAGVLIVGQLVFWLWGSWCLDCGAVGVLIVGQLVFWLWGSWCFDCGAVAQWELCGVCGDITRASARPLPRLINGHIRISLEMISRYGETTVSYTVWNDGRRTWGGRTAWELNVGLERFTLSCTLIRSIQKGFGIGRNPHNWMRNVWWTFQIRAAVLKQLNLFALYPPTPTPVLNISFLLGWLAAFRCVDNVAVMAAWLGVIFRKCCGTKQCWVIAMSCLVFSSNDTVKSKKKKIGRWCERRDLNVEPPETVASMPTGHPRRFMCLHRFTTRWFKYDRDWFVCKQAALRSSYATLREWSHNLHPPSCSG